MNNTEPSPDMEKYVRTEEFHKNLKTQKELFDALCQQLQGEHWHGFPFSSWHEFMYHYIHFRAGLSSMLKNPDTMNDPNLLELCDTWKHQQLGHIDDGQLEALYKKLMTKPVFRENYIFNNLFGEYLKSIHQLLNSDSYTQHFFELDA